MNKTTLQQQAETIRTQLAALPAGERLDVSDVPGLAVFMATPNVTRGPDGRWWATYMRP